MPALQKDKQKETSGFPDETEEEAGKAAREISAAKTVPVFRKT